MDVKSIALNRLKMAALRPTAVRIAILQALGEHGHPTTEDLIQRLNRSGDFGRATIYQNLQRLVKASLVRELMGDDGIHRYDGNLSPHQHLVCDESGQFVDVMIDPKVMQSLRPLDPHTGKPLRDWEVGEVRVIFRARRRSKATRGM